MSSTLKHYLDSWTKILNNTVIETESKNKTDNIFKRELLFEKKKKFSFDFGTLTMPLVRRVFASTIGTDLVSVQPLSAPTGLLHYIDFEYEKENEYRRELLIEKYKKYRTRRSRRGPNIKYSNL
jgi:hypothetical protein